MNKHVLGTTSASCERATGIEPVVCPEGPTIDEATGGQQAAESRDC